MLRSLSFNLIVGEEIRATQRIINTQIEQNQFHNEPREGNLFRNICQNDSVETIRQRLTIPMDVEPRSSSSKPTRSSSKRKREETTMPPEAAKRQRSAATKPFDMLTERGPAGEIPLHVACLHRAEDMAIELIEQHRRHNVSLDLGYDGEAFHGRPNEPSMFEGENSLHIAVAQGSMPIVDALLHPSVPEEQRKNLLSGRATGLFFHPSIEHSGQPKERAGDGRHYFGEFPLGFAISLGKLEMCEKLIDAASSPAALLKAVDSEGNTLAHLCVINRQLGTLKHLHRRHPAEVAWMLEQRNQEKASDDANALGLTPLMKAARVGYADAFEWLERHKRTVLWRFGNTSCELVPLDDIDPIRGDNHGALSSDANPQRRARQRSTPFRKFFVDRTWPLQPLVDRALGRRTMRSSTFAHEILWGLLNDVDQYEHKHLLRDGSLAWLLVDTKWKAFAKAAFHKRARSALLVCVVFGVGICRDTHERSAVRNIGFMASAVWDADWDHLSVDSLVLASAQFFSLRFSFRKLQIELREMCEAGSGAYWNVRGARLLENVCSLLSCALLLLSALAHIALVEGPCDEGGTCEQSERWRWLVPTLQAVASLSSWGYLFFVLLGIRRVGKFVVMLWEMLLNDITSYMLVFSVIVAGFMQAFWALMKPDFRSWWQASALFAHLTHAMMGSTEALEEFGAKNLSDNDFKIRADRASVQARNAELPDDVETFSFNRPMLIVLIAIYILVATLMMFNTLLAAMNKTFEVESDDADMRWRLERVRIIASLESEMNAADAPETVFWVYRECDEARKLGHRWVQVRTKPEDAQELTAAVLASSHIDALKDQIRAAAGVEHPWSKCSEEDVEDERSGGGGGALQEAVFACSGCGLVWRDAQFEKALPMAVLESCGLERSHYVCVGNECYQPRGSMKRYLLDVRAQDEDEKGRPREAKGG